MATRRSRADFRKETPALVGIVNRRKDWLIVETQNWYRIPVKSAPQELNQCRYLAFYRTKTLGEPYWSITHYARITDISTTLRRELLPDEPEHARADEQYYRVSLAELRSLPQPIVSRCGRRIAFIPTSRERLLRAKEINELFRTSPIEDIMLQSLETAKLPAERQYLVREYSPGYLLDFALFCRNGKLNIECDGERYHSGAARAQQDRIRDNHLTASGWHILRFSGNEIIEDIDLCLMTIKRTIQQLGGLERNK